MDEDLPGFAAEAPFSAGMVVVQKRRTRNSGDGAGTTSPITDPGLWFFRMNAFRGKFWEIYRNHP